MKDKCIAEMNQQEMINEIIRLRKVENQKTEIKYNTISILVETKENQYTIFNIINIKIWKDEKNECYINIETYDVEENRKVRIKIYIGEYDLVSNFLEDLMKIKIISIDCYENILEI